LVAFPQLPPLFPYAHWVSDWVQEQAGHLPELRGDDVDDVPPRSDHSDRLGHGESPILDVFDHMTGENQIEYAIGKRQRFGVSESTTRRRGRKATRVDAKDAGKTLA